VGDASMNLIINKEDLLNILGWAGLARNVAENTQVGFDESEEKTLIKLKSKLGDKGND